MKYIFPLVLLATITVGVIFYTLRVIKEKLYKALKLIDK